MTPEYVNILLNACQQHKRQIKFTEEHSGPEHDKTFTVIVFIDGIEAGKGAGKTKGSAKAEACRMALEWIGFL